MIPSAHRTKIDKIRAISRRKEQDRAYRSGNKPEARTNDLRFRVNNQDDASEAMNEFEDISELDEHERARLDKKLEKAVQGTTHFGPMRTHCSVRWLGAPTEKAAGYFLRGGAEVVAEEMRKKVLS